MKKSLVIAIALFTLNGMAQERKQKKDRKDKSELREEMTPSDIATLKAKRMTLKLDLTDGQQQKVQNLFLTQETTKQSYRKSHKRADGEKREKPSKEEFLKMQNNRLDQQIEMKREMKTILTSEQYSQFEKMKPREHKRKDKRGKKEKENQDR